MARPSARSPAPDALFARSDPPARGRAGPPGTAGRRVPEDAAAGFDDSAAARSGRRGPTVEDQSAYSG